LASYSHGAGPNPRGASTLVWAGPRSLARTRGSRLLSLPPGNEMFQFPGLLPALARRVSVLRPTGFPHSEILDHSCLQLPQALSQLTTFLQSPPCPRHPPCALTRLISVSRCDSSNNTTHTLVSCQRTSVTRFTTPCSTNSCNVASGNVQL